MARVPLLTIETAFQKNYLKIRYTNWRRAAWRSFETHKRYRSTWDYPKLDWISERWVTWQAKVFQIWQPFPARRNMESLEASLSAEKCPGTACQEPRRERRSIHREAELPSLRYDDPSVERQPRQIETSEKGIQSPPFHPALFSPNALISPCRFKMPFSANGSTIRNELISECCRWYSSHTPAMSWRMPLHHLTTTTTTWRCVAFASCWTWTSSKRPPRRPPTTSSGRSSWRSLNNG